MMVIGMVVLVTFGDAIAKNDWEHEHTTCFYNLKLVSVTSKKTNKQGTIHFYLLN